ncbi:MAG: TIM barrel protein [Bacteroidia bacterium]|nr:TIM barrel protein [Bacteroidia bacterium]
MPAKKNIGLQLWSIRDSIMKNVPGAIAKVGKMGYNFVEPAGYGDGKFYNMKPAAFKTLCNTNGLTVLSSHTGQALPDSANWEKTMTWWDACIDAHVTVGAKFLVQPFMGEEAYRSLDTLKRYCDYFNIIGEKCNAKGIRFGYHNHSEELSTQLEGQTIYDFMLANTDPAKVMFEMDLYWAVEGGADPVGYFNKYPGRFELWHIKDKAEVGASGKMDFAAIWAGAAKSGLKYGIVEVEEYNFDEFTSCQKSFDFLNAAPYVVMPVNK